MSVLTSCSPTATPAGMPSPPRGRPVVLVDAALPPESGDATLAPQALLDHLAGLADADGFLPPWTRWWSDEDLATVVPDPEVLADIRAVEPRLPLAYVRGRLGAPSRWQEAPQAFLALGGTYADETALRGPARLARTAVLDGALHLHHLVDPDAVAAAVVDLRVPPRPRVSPQKRSWSRGEDHGVTGRGTGTPSTSRSVRSE